MANGEGCRTCVSMLNGSAALSGSSRGECGCTFECMPCVQRRENLFANSEGEKGERGRVVSSAAVFD